MRTDKIMSNGIKQRTPEYVSWGEMKQRCYNKSNKDFKNYGGRGICVCDEWRNSYPTFLEDMGRRPSSKHSIDRIDNNDYYKPSNCRWATITEQNRNKGTSIVKSWILAEELGVTRKTATGYIGAVRRKDENVRMSEEKKAHIRDFMERMGCE